MQGTSRRRWHGQRESEVETPTKPTKSKTGKDQITAKESRPTIDGSIDLDDAAAPKKKKMRS